MLYRYIWKYNFTLDLHTIKQKKKLKDIELDLNHVELILGGKNYGTHCTGDHFALKLFLLQFTV